jgi:dipeptidyl aminopeptidase/acylaminoacyl peptidase
VFNFSHNGVGIGEKRFTEKDSFEHNTFSEDLLDVQAILDVLESGSVGEASKIDAARVGIIGHSRGGGIALLAAAAESRIKAVAAWSSVARFDRYTAEQKLRWREKGTILLSSPNFPSGLRIGTDLLDDLEENSGRLNILDAVRRMEKPLLIVHGSADIPVKLSEAQEIFDASEKNLTEFVILKDTGHMYGARHPYRKESVEMTRVIDLTAAWFQKNL